MDEPNVEPTPTPVEPTATSAEPDGPTGIEPTLTPVEPTTAGAEPDGPTGGWIVPPPAPGRSGRKKAAILAGLAAIVAIPGVKIVTTLLAASVASTALGSAFGGPYAQLPGDFRSGIETRFKAILPADFEKLTDTEQIAWIRKQEEGGLVRLDDANLTRRLGLYVEGLGQMPVAACAAFVRETANGGETSSATNNAFLTALSVDERKDWIEIAIGALEAQVHATPVPRIVTDEEANGILSDVGSLATPDEQSAIRAYGGGTAGSDAALCAGLRAVYAIFARLPAADRTTVARYDLQP
jgi:hypothetical protein